MTSAPSARAKRDEAARARRLAATFPLDVHRQPLLDHAEELERQAEALDRQAAPAAGPSLVEQQQVQQQQQQSEAAAGDEHPPPRPKPG
jgi:hypothetical protein